MILRSQFFESVIQLKSYLTSIKMRTATTYEVNERTTRLSEIVDLEKKNGKIKAIIILR